MQVLNTDADSNFNTGMNMIGLYMYTACSTVWIWLVLF